MSVILQINSPDRMPLVDLWRLIFKFTFEKKACSYTAKQTIETNVIKWSNLINAQKKIIAERFGLEGNFVPVGKKGSVLDEIEFQVGNMCQWIVKEEKGEFQHLVDTYGRNKIDYRLAQPMAKVFPECAKLRDFKGGLEALKRAMKDNPEDYNVSKS